MEIKVAGVGLGVGAGAGEDGDGEGERGAVLGEGDAVEGELGGWVRVVVTTGLG